MLTLSNVNGNSEATDYYLSGAGEYYLGEGDRSFFSGKIANDFLIDGKSVTKELIDLFIRGFGIDGGKLVLNADDKNRRGGLDLTFSAPKSVSIMALYDPKIIEAFEKATKVLIQTVEKEYLRSRISIEGEIKEVGLEKSLFATFFHHFSRNGDPQLHTHNILFNFGVDKHGKVRSLHNDSIFKNSHYIGLVAARADLATRLKDLGYEINVTDRKNGLFEIGNFPKELLEHFSSRSEEISKKSIELQEKMPNVDPTVLRQLAALNTRKEKSTDLFQESASLAKEEVLNFCQAKFGKAPQEFMKGFLKNTILDSFGISQNDLSKISGDLKKEVIHFFVAFDELSKSSEFKKEMGLKDVVDRVATSIKDGKSNSVLATFKEELQKTNLNSLDILESLNSIIAEHRSLNNQSKDLVAAMSATVKQVEKNHSSWTKKTLFDAVAKQSLGKVDTSLEKLDEAFFKLALEVGENKIVKNGEKESGKRISENHYSTQKMIDLEKRVLSILLERKDRHHPLLSADKIQKIILENKTLTNSQKIAIEKIGKSKDGVILVQGDAGTGKTTAIAALKKEIDENLYNVTGLVSTNTAANELRQKTGIKTQTVHSFLKASENSPNNLKKNLYILDEAGLVSSSEIKLLLEKVGEESVFIFIGDKKQNFSVGEGKMFKDVLDQKILPIIELTDLVRQKTEIMRSVVGELNKFDREGRTDFSGLEKAFHRLKKEGSIVSPSQEKEKGVKIDIEKRTNFLSEQIAKKYVENLKSGSTTLVVTDTNQKKQNTSLSIREEMKKEGAIDLKTEQIFFTENTIKLSEVGKHNIGNYSQGQKITFFNEVELLNGEKIKKGEFGIVLSTNPHEKNLVLQMKNKKNKQGRTVTIPIDERGVFQNVQVTEKQSIPIAVGDKLVFTKKDNLLIEKTYSSDFAKITDSFLSSLQYAFVGIKKDSERIMINHGDQGTVTGIKDGVLSILHTNGKEFKLNFSEKRKDGINRYTSLDYAYASTIDSSQGKTVNNVIAWVDSATTYFNPVYTALTRAEMGATIFTDNPSRFIKNIANDGPKASTLEKYKTKEIIKELTDSEKFLETIKGIEVNKSVWTLHDILKANSVTKNADKEKIQSLVSSLRDLKKQGTIKEAGLDYISKASYYSTAEMMNLERQVLSLVLDGQNKVTPFFDKEITQKSLEIRSGERKFSLTDGQKKAIEHVLTTKDQFIMVQGDAGSGKTTLFEEVKNILNDSKKEIPIRGLGPTKTAVRALSAVGIESSTIDSFMLNPKNHSEDARKNELWIVDEMSMINSTNFLKLLSLAQRRDSRIVFSGDVKQFDSIGQGHMAKNLQEAGISMAIMPETVRQKTEYTKKLSNKMKAFHETGDSNYLESVFETIKEKAYMLKYDTSQGKLKDFQEKKHKIISSLYLRDPENSIVITKANKERAAINDVIRKDMLTAGKIDNSKPLMVMSLRAITMDNIGKMKELEKKIDPNFKTQVVFQDTVFAKLEGEKEITKDIMINGGDIGNLISIDKNNHTLKIDVNKRIYEVDLSRHENAEKIQLYSVVPLEIAVGDKLILKRNEHGLSSGTMGMIKSIDQNGNVSLFPPKGENAEVKFNPSSKYGAYRFIEYGYAVTPEASQGLSVERVIQNFNEFTDDFKSTYVGMTRAIREYIPVFNTNEKDKILTTFAKENGKKSTLDFGVIVPEKVMAELERSTEFSKKEITESWGNLNQLMASDYYKECVEMKHSGIMRPIENKEDYFKNIMSMRDEMFKNPLLADEVQNKNLMRVFELPEEALTFKSGMNPLEHCCYQPKEFIKYKEMAMGEIGKDRTESRGVEQKNKTQSIEKELER